VTRETPGGVLIRPGMLADAPGLNAVYNHFVENTAVTFDVTPMSLEDRKRWLRRFADGGPYRLLVAVSHSALVGFACSKQFRAKEAYATSVETTIYLTPEETGQGTGALLYAALFEALAAEDVHRAYAGITIPNEASVALHRKLGFRNVGIYREVGRKFGRYWNVQWFEKGIESTGSDERSGA